MTKTNPMNDWVKDLLIDFIRDSQILVPCDITDNIWEHLETLAQDLREGFNTERDYEYRPESPHIGEIKTLKEKLFKIEEQLTKQYEQEIKEVQDNWQWDYNQLASDYCDLKKELDKR